MVNMNGLLPLIDSSSWQWNVQSGTKEDVSAGDSTKLVDSTSETGMLYWGLIVVDGQKGYETEISINSGLFSVNRTFQDLYKYGVTGRGPGLLNITRYDTSDDVFAAIYEPRPPLPYNSNLSIKLAGSPDGGVDVTYDFLELEITDEESFVGSLREMLFSDIVNQQEQLNSKLDLLSSQIAQTNTILANQLTPETLDNIAQGETVGEETEVDFGSIISPGGNGQGGTGSTDSESDRDEDLETLGQ